MVSTVRLANPTATERPLAESARHIFGTALRRRLLAGAGIHLRIFRRQYALHTPRLTFALAECGDFRDFFCSCASQISHSARVYYRLHDIAAYLHGVGNFRWKYYPFRGGKIADLCLIFRGAAVLRIKHPEADAFRLRVVLSSRITDMAAFCVVFIYADAAQQLVRRYRGHHTIAPDWLLVRNNNTSRI